MGLNEWLAILGAVGGTSTITWAVTFWVNRKTNARKEDASADAMENENERGLHGRGNPGETGQIRYYAGGGDAMGHGSADEGVSVKRKCGSMERS